MKNLNGKRRRKRTRIANKPRFALFCAVCTVVITMLVSSITSAQATKTAETYTLCISSGDTLWEIARSSNTKGKDLRKVVDDIMRLNNMRTTCLRTGDVIEIPIY